MSTSYTIKVVRIVRILYFVDMGLWSSIKMYKTLYRVFCVLTLYQYSSAILIES